MSSNYMSFHSTIHERLLSFKMAIDKEGRNSRKKTPFHHIPLIWLDFYSNMINVLVLDSFSFNQSCEASPSASFLLVESLLGCL